MTAQSPTTLPWSFKLLCCMSTPTPPLHQQHIQQSECTFSLQQGTLIRQESEGSASIRCHYRVLQILPIYSRARTCIPSSTSMLARVSILLLPSPFCQHNRAHLPLLFTSTHSNCGGNKDDSSKGSQRACRWRNRPSLYLSQILCQCHIRVC